MWVNLLAMGASLHCSRTIHSLHAYLKPCDARCPGSIHVQLPVPVEITAIGNRPAQIPFEFKPGE